MNGRAIRVLLKAGVAALIILALCRATPAAAGPLEDAKVAYDREDYATALRLFRPRADQGLADAQNNLGAMYAKGQGVPQDYAEAVKWYRKAADQGYAFAQNNLGGMYAKGRGVTQDDAQAVRWFRKAADQSDALAQNNLGLMYVNMRDVVVGTVPRPGR